MAEQKRIVQYGIDKVYIAELTKDDETGAIYSDELIRLEGAQNLEITETSVTAELPGDNGIIDTITRITGYTVSLSHGVLTHEQQALMQGGTIVTNGEKQSFVTKNGDTGKYYGLIGIVENTGAKIVLPKVKTSTMTIPFASGEFSVVSLEATAIKRAFDGLMRVHTIHDNTPASVADFVEPVPTP